MATINAIPTGDLPYITVSELPQTGEEWTVYGVLQNDPGEWERAIYKDYIYRKGEWQEVDLNTFTFGFIFGIYQDTMNEVIADLNDRIEALEGGKKLLFEGSNIELTEAGATRGVWIDVTSDITVSEGTTFYVTLQNMTLDGEPIEDYYGEGIASGVPGWDWQGSDFYDTPFGGGAYFAFGTEPKDAVANKVTLGFVNEGDGFPVRTLVIGHIKVEVK